MPWQRLCGWICVVFDGVGLCFGVLEVILGPRIEGAGVGVPVGPLILGWWLLIRYPRPVPEHPRHADGSGQPSICSSRTHARLPVPCAGC